ncbi:MAG: methyltransferase domain-containing protein [Patescibacteria group bacterium]
MTVNEEFIKILCCPKRLCRGDLAEVETVKSQTYLVCQSCADEYPVVEGIPILYPNNRYAPFTHARHWDQEENAVSYAKKYDSYLKKQGSPWGLYTHESEILAIKKLTRNLDLKGGTIIDGGCGNGRLLSLYPEAKTKIGIDTSLSLLKATKRREPDFWLVCGQLEDMPFKDAVADFSVSVRVYQHLRSPEAAFSEMVRVTKPTGHVSLEVYNKLNLKELYKKIRMLPWFNRRWPWGLTYDRYYSYREINKWCDQTFVKPVAFAGAGWGIHFYFLELIRFRHLAPKALQKIVFGFFYWLEDRVGTWPVFSKTLEKICFIGSVQAPLAKRSPWSRAYRAVARKLNYRQIEHFQLLMGDRNYSLVGNDRHHLRLTLAWLKQAQDATPDGGVSRSFSLVKNEKSNRLGWQPSYPETTGYIIPTILQAAKLLGDEDLIRRARLMADWELGVMLPDGSVHGGNIGEACVPAVFDTGQVIRGLLAIYEETGEEKFLTAAKRSADWILSKEDKGLGRWTKDNARSVDQESSTYNIYAVVPIIELGQKLNEDKYLALGKRVGDFTLKQQLVNGWFGGSDFRSKDDALLHTIAYTIDGLWDTGTLLKNERLLASARKSLDGVITQMDELGFLPGRLTKDWQGATTWACLTGMAQIGVTCLKVYRTTAEKKYLTASRLIKDYLKTCQNNLNPKYGGLGAVWGSWPISGQYGQYQALNWAAKYFADLLLSSIETTNEK